jgi:hypothetical protein
VARGTRPVPLGFCRDLGSLRDVFTNPEEFARSTGAERLTLATAHDNLAAQHIYENMGYVREEHFLYFHRLPP